MQSSMYCFINSLLHDIYMPKKMKCMGKLTTESSSRLAQGSSCKQVIKVDKGNNCMLRFTHQPQKQTGKQAAK